jgi:hypothetical protein
MECLRTTFHNLGDDFPYFRCVDCSPRFFEITDLAPERPQRFKSFLDDFVFRSCRIVKHSVGFEAGLYVCKMFPQRLSELSNRFICLY